jgi:diketogulonate reductase-like aldo/keto reductase
MYKKGESGNPGGRRKKIDAMREEALMAAEEGDIRDIFKALIERAKKGNVRAAQLILPYLIGRPDVVVSLKEYQPEQITPLFQIIKPPTVDAEAQVVDDSSAI